MKKIMFNDKYGLTKAVLEGRKTMTRRIVRNPEEVEINGHAYLRTEKLRYKVGDIVAVAQSYKDIREELGESGVSPFVAKAGYRNKMYVRADLMPHRIRITNVRVERLQDISDEDCIREGIQAVRIPDGWRYVAGGSKIYESDRNRIWSGELKLSEKCAFNSPYAAFAALIDKVSGKGTWETNPWVYVYEFELIMSITNSLHIFEAEHGNMSFIV